MPPAESQAQPPKFRLWLRRLGVNENPFALRFEVHEGKGILRVSRPGVLIDPPARQIGLEERLSMQQLRTTRFILVWDGGRARQGHQLSRLDDAALERVEVDRWHELEVVSEGGFRYLLLAVAPTGAPTVAPKPKSRRPSLNELRQELDSLTLRSEEDEDPDSALDSITGPVPAARRPSLTDARTNGEVTEIPPVVPVDPPLVKSEPPRVLAPDTHEVAFAKGGGRKGRAARQQDGADNDDAFVNSRTLVDEGEAFPERQLPRRGAPPATTADLAAFDAPEPSLPRMPGLPAPRVHAPPPPAPDTDDSDTLALDEADGSEDAEALALGEADGSEDAESLALGEAESNEDAEALVLGDSADRLATEPIAPPPPAAPAPAALPSPTVAAFAGFTDEDEEAAFSVDLPSHRKSTEHVSIHRAVGDAITSVDMSFAREVLPAVEDLALPEPEEAAEEVAAVAPPVPQPRGNGVFDQPGAPPAPTGRPPRPRRGGAEAPAAAAAELDEADMLGRGTTLVRHLRRQLEEQRHRIAELEAQVAELQESQRRG